jgi:Fe-S-cluster containining protein
MKPNKVKSLLKPLYYKMDNELKIIPNVCEKGCFYCCYQPIELLLIEKITLADYILKELNEETKQQIIEKVIEWLDFFDENTSDLEPLTGNEAFREFRFRAENIPFPCPLLINGECSVYKARPLTCRAHFVNDSKELCLKDKLRDGSEISFQYRVKVVNELKSNVEIEIVPLAYALVEILKIDRKLKRIEKSILR